MSFHVPVLLEESAELVITNKTGIYFDATLGFGGHTSKFLSRLDENAKLFATDKDKDAYNFCEEKFKDDERITIYNAAFTEIRNISLVENIDGYDGIFADLGVSSFQFDNKESGFTYRNEAVLDLRMDKSVGEPAYKFINKAEADEIADVIFNFGEERKSRTIARSIVKHRLVQPIKTTTQLKSAIEKVVPVKNLNKTLSRVFQALRIYINNELDELKDFLNKSLELLKPDGRLVVLAYHSLEDRIVKEFFKYEALTCICEPEVPICVCNKKKSINILTRKPMVASESEIKSNPRARSVKLRAAEKI